MATLIPPAPSTRTPRPPGDTSPPEPTRRRRRLPWLVVGLTVAVLALAAFWLLRGPQPVDVLGAVTDGRTGTPVSGATVSTGEDTTTTGDDGRFSLTVDPDAVLTIEAERYEPTEASVAEVVDVSLTPVSITGTVTSRMTGEPVVAALEFDGDEVEVSTDEGTFIAYGIQKGDEITVSAAGHLSGTLVVTDEPVEVALVPEKSALREQIAAWVASGDFQALSEWVFRDDLGLLFAPMSEAYEWGPADTVSLEPDVFAFGDGRDVLGTLDLVQLFVVRPDRQSDALYGWTAEEEPGWITVEDEILLGGEAYEDPDSYVLMWFREPLMVTVHASSYNEAGRVLGAIMAGQGFDLAVLEQALADAAIDSA